MLTALAYFYLHHTGYWSTPLLLTALLYGLHRMMARRIEVVESTPPLDLRQSRLISADLASRWSRALFRSRPPLARSPARPLALGAAL